MKKVILTLMSCFISQLMYAASPSISLSVEAELLGGTYTFKDYSYNDMYDWDLQTFSNKVNSQLRTQTVMLSFSAPVSNKLLLDFGVGEKWFDLNTYQSNVTHYNLKGNVLKASLTYTFK